jgi:hypothetical protein
MENPVRPEPFWICALLSRFRSSDTAPAAKVFTGFRMALALMIPGEINCGILSTADHVGPTMMPMKRVAPAVMAKKRLVFMVPALHH